MLQRLLRRLGRGTLDLVLPLQCMGCRKEGSGLCQVCQSSLARLEPPYCEICAQPNDGPRCSRCVESPPPIDGIKAPYLMEGVIRDAIHALPNRLQQHEHSENLLGWRQGLSVGFFYAFPPHSAWLMSLNPLHIPVNALEWQVSETVTADSGVVIVHPLKPFQG